MLSTTQKQRMRKGSTRLFESWLDEPTARRHHLVLLSHVRLMAVGGKHRCSVDPGCLRAPGVPTVEMHMSVQSYHTGAIQYLFIQNAYGWSSPLQWDRPKKGVRLRLTNM